MKEERILDSRIAEKIMGLVVFQSDEYGPVYEIHNDLTPIPSYSTDIAAAWHVVEKLRKDYGICLSVYNDGAVRVELSETRLSFDPENIVIIRDTAPLAICLAALKAVEVEE